MGRPPGRIQDRPFQMRLSSEFLERLDEWRRKQPEPPSRAGAIRRLTTAMLRILDEDNGEKSAQLRKSLFSPRAPLFDSNLYGRLMSPSQCRAARGLLNWTQDEMAAAARLSVVTVRNFENEKSTPQRATLDVHLRRLASSSQMANSPASASPAPPQRGPRDPPACQIRRLPPKHPVAKPRGQPRC
jgi:DNA-binding XRE family transcriptional regulator